MPQSILVQVGQCGNQVGFRFWQSIVKEYEALRKTLSDEQMSYFLKPKEKMTGDDSFDECYAPRGVLVDMEEGVINEGCRGALKKMFNRRQILTDVSGSGNNWAMGNKYYAKIHCNKIEEILRLEAEACDTLESFLFTFSLGGGTGSGLGTAVLELIQTIFPKTPKLVFPVYPSLVDDVITSPYNTLLANNKLSEHADLVIAFDNQALYEICMSIDKTKNKFHPQRKLISQARSSKSAGVSKYTSKPFDDMNDLIASVMLDFTSCSRLPGSLNIDLNDFVTNFTPYPILKYIVPSCSPFILAPEDSKLETLFTELFASNHTLMHCNVNHSLLIAAAVLGRGSVTLLDMQINISRLSKNMRFCKWGDSSFKMGLSDFPPAGRHVSLLKVCNACSIARNFEQLKETFEKMYQKKAHVHHFYDIQNMEECEFSNALTTLQKVISSYKEMEAINNINVMQNAMSCHDNQYPKLNLL